MISGRHSIAVAGGWPLALPEVSGARLVSIEYTGIMVGGYIWIIGRKPKDPDRWGGFLLSSKHRSLQTKFGPNL